MSTYIKIVVAAAFLVAAAWSWQLAQFENPLDRRNWKKVSPFTAVEFSGETVLAEYQQNSYEVVSIAGIGMEELVEAAKEEFGSLWQKRIREDIAEGLGAAGVSDFEHVDLELKDPETGAVTIVIDAEMTKENRSAIYNAIKSKKEA